LAASAFDHPDYVRLARSDAAEAEHVVFQILEAVAAEVTIVSVKRSATNGDPGRKGRYCA
jgi:hypothetical protein